MSGHSILPPSSAAIWGAPEGCRGWAAMAPAFPEPPGSRGEDAEGTAAHEVAAALLAQYFEDPTLRTVPSAGDSSAGVVITEELYAHAKDYADRLGAEYQRRAQRTGLIRYGIEDHVTAPSVHELSEGTVDYWLWDPVAEELIISDLKYGHGLIDARMNWQLLNYAAGLADRLQLWGSDTRVILRIIQPRGYRRGGPVDEWTLTMAELAEYTAELRRGAEESLTAGAQCRSGTHCRYCPARHACQAAIDAALSMYEVCGPALPLDVPPDALGYRYELVKRARAQLEYLEKGYEAQLTELIRGGAAVRSHKLEAAEGREVWSATEEEVIAAGRLMGVEVATVKLLTPNQAREAGLAPDLVASYSHRPGGKLKLVKIDESKAMEVFK